MIIFLILEVGLKTPKRTEKGPEEKGKKLDSISEGPVSAAHLCRCREILRSLISALLLVVFTGASLREMTFFINFFSQ